ncbi:MAG: SBBP repeat-containing protein [Ignavibacteria bacterium]|nr:SBBP repeat-containing protein [Ignavibacteria bacterium]
MVVRNFYIIVLFLTFLSFRLLAFTGDYFVENKGQWPGQIKFAQLKSNYNFLVTQQGIAFDYFEIERDVNSTLKKGHFVRINFEKSKFENFLAKEPSNWGISYIFGNKVENWVHDVKGYREILITDIYPEIDLLVKNQEGNPRYDLIVNPGGEVDKIVLNFEGAFTTIADGKNLVIETRFGKVYNGSLFAYQDENGIKAEVECKFISLGENKFTFEVGPYDKSQRLIIDPIVLFSYLGGSGDEEIVALKELNTGVLLAVGWTESPNFPTRPGAYDESYNGMQDVFISKFDLRNAKRELLYSTFLGGTTNDSPVALSLDVSGNIYLAGTTNSTDFPVVNAANQTINGLSDVFITKFAPDLKNIIYSTYLGGNREDIATAGQIASDNGFFVCGYTTSTNLPVTGGAYQTKIKGREDIFIIKLSSSGRLIEYCTYFGGGDDDRPYAMAVGTNIFITGGTKSSDFPLVPLRTGWGGQVVDSPYDRAFNGGWDAFAIKILGGEGKVDYSTYFGGSADDIGLAVSYTADQKIIFSGVTYKETTSRPSFPVSTNAFQSTHKGGADVFVAQLSNIIETRDSWGNISRRQDLVFSTFLGGSLNDFPTTLDFENNQLYITGYTNSTNFPIVSNPTGKKIGKYDIFYAEMVSDGSSLNFTDIFGTLDDDSTKAFCLTETRDFYIAGVTNSKNMTTINPIGGTGYGGSNDVLLLKFTPAEIRLDYPTGAEKICPNTNLSIRWASETLPATDTFDIEIKKSYASPWEPLKTDVKGTSYTWAIPPTFFADSLWIRVSHKRGVIATLRAPITIYELPSILESGSQPENTVVCEGDSVKLFVKARGSNIRIQWLHNGNILPNARDTVLVIRNINESVKGKYKAIVSGPCPVTAETPEFSIDFIPETKILSHSSDTIVRKGETLNLFVSAKGDKISYQWFKDGFRLFGADKPILTVNRVSVADAGIYNCKISGTCGIDSTKSIKVEVDTTPVVKVDLIEQSNEIKVFYDETNCNVILSNISCFEDFDYRIYNIFGREIALNEFRYNGLSKQIHLNVSSIPNGIYYLKIKCKGQDYFVSIPVIK